MKNGHTTRQKTPAGRYALLDELRGLDLVSMMLYHACWDLVFLFDVNMRWYAGTPGRLWQQTICWVFILLSGFCAPFGRYMLRRGTVVFGAGAPAPPKRNRESVPRKNSCISVRSDQTCRLLLVAASEPSAASNS